MVAHMRKGEQTCTSLDMSCLPCTSIYEAWRSVSWDVIMSFWPCRIWRRSRALATLLQEAQNTVTTSNC